MSDLFNEFTQLREDGRKANEVRFIDAQISTIPGCTGSSHFKIGETEIIAQVFGPKEPLMNKTKSTLAEIRCSFNFSQFAKIPHPSESKILRDKESEFIIKRVFEAAIRRDQFPGSIFEIYITVIQDDGSSIPAAINAVTLALMDGGIPMWDLATGTSVSYICDHILLDAGRKESRSTYPYLELAFFPTSKKIISMTTTTSVPDSILDQMIEMAKDGCSLIKEHIHDLIMKDKTIFIQDYL